MSAQTVVKNIPDVFREGMAQGWQTVNGATLTQPRQVECDVLIIGTGAGGGTAAEILAQAGLKVVLLEEGPLKTSNQFDMQELPAYTDLYQEGLTRGTTDGGMTIMQGRTVGGSTTVNWTASFRTPPETLQYWSDELGLSGFSVAEMAPWFERMEQRLNIAPWALPPNENNSVLARGCDALKLDWAIIPRNVKGCWNLGYCGMGCPTNAKQSMLVTTIPAALSNGAQLYYRTRADRLMHDGERVTGVVATGLRDDGITPTQPLKIVAGQTIMACGGINGPGLLLRSEVPDPHGQIGKRTFLHPVCATLADFAEPVNGFYGAPQSVYSDHFQWRDGVSGRVGFKLEVPPLHPGFVASIGMGHGEAHSQQMNRLPHLNMTIALMRDGFTAESQGGSVSLRNDGMPAVDYPISDYLREGTVRAWKAMAEIQFAAGAKSVRPIHSDGEFSTSLDAFEAQIGALDLSVNRLRLGSAHVMGGCCMGEDPATSVVDSRGRFHQLRNLHIMDGSIFPTSIGANPQLSIYGMVARQATELAAAWRPEASPGATQSEAAPG